MRDLSICLAVSAAFFLYLELEKVARLLRRRWAADA
jgi:hypothetical protein